MKTKLDQQFDELWDNDCIVGNEYNPTDTMYYEGFISAIYKYAMYVRDEQIPIEIQQEKERVLYKAKKILDKEAEYYGTDKHGLSYEQLEFIINKKNK
jgi:hypothetical protein